MAEDKVEEGLLQLQPHIVGNGNQRLIVRVVGRPVGLDEKSQGAESRLTNVGGNGHVGGDVCERDGEGWVLAGAVELDLGLLTRALFGELRVG
jgi:hypothetical protein